MQIRRNGRSESCPSFLLTDSTMLYYKAMLNKYFFYQQSAFGIAGSSASTTKSRMTSESPPSGTGMYYDMPSAFPTYNLEAAFCPFRNLEGSHFSGPNSGAPDFQQTFGHVPEDASYFQRRVWLMLSCNSLLNVNALVLPTEEAVLQYNDALAAITSRIHIPNMRCSVIISGSTMTIGWIPK